MKIDRPLCPEGFGEPYVHQPPATLLQRARRWLDDLTRAEGHPNLYAPAQRLTRGARGRTMTRRGLLALALAAGGAITAHPAMAFFRGGGGVVSGGVTLLTTTTRNNTGGAETNVQFRFAQAFRRGDVPTSGYTFVLQDASGTLPMQYDQRSDYNGQAASTDVANIRMVEFSTILPTVAATSNHTVSIYKQAGTYTPGTPVSMAPLTALQIVKKFGNSTWPARDCNANLVGSGQFQFIVNNYSSIAFSPNGSGTGIPGGYRTTSAGSVQTTQLITGAFTDVSGGAPFVHMYEEFYATVWSNGRVEFMPRFNNGWINQSTPTPSLYWGDLSLYQANGSTLLRSWTQNYTFGASAVSLAAGQHPTATGVTLACTGTTTVTVTSPENFNSSYVIGQYIYIAPGTALTTGNYLITGFTDSHNVVVASSPGTGSGATWRIGGGTIANPGTIQMGQGLVFTTTGTLPSPLVPGALTFGCFNSVPGSGVYQPLFLTTNCVADGNIFQFLTIGDVGSPGTGTPHTMTQMFTVNTFQGVYLPADDTGNAWFLPARTATLYPNLTNAERLYWMQTGLVPPYNLTAPTGGAFTTNYWTQYGGCGQYYRPNSMALESTNIGAGGTHAGIGWWGDFSASAWLSQATTMWDQLRATALSENQMSWCSMLNVLTGYIPALDNGLNGAGSSYPTIGAPFPNAYCYVSNGSYGGFSFPAYPTNLGASAFFPLGWWSGIASNSASGSDHWPDMGLALSYFMNGEPWIRDQIYRDANFAIFNIPISGITNKQLTVGSTTYYAKIMFAGQQQRTAAWGIRNMAYAAVIGANANPEQALWWNIIRQNIRAFYDITQNYLLSASYPALGFLSTDNTYEGGFLDSYFGHAMGCMCGMIHQDESAILAGASTTYILNYAVRFNVLLQNNTYMSNFWAAAEYFANMAPYSTLAGGPGSTFAATMADVGVWMGPGTYQAPISVNTSGVMSMSGWSATDQLSQYYGNGDRWIPQNSAAQTTWGTGVGSGNNLYVVNFTAGSPPTFQFSHTIGGSPIIPSAANSNMEFSIIPAARGQRRPQRFSVTTRAPHCTQPISWRLCRTRPWQARRSQTYRRR